MIEFSHYWRSCDRNLYPGSCLTLTSIDCHKLMKSVGMLC
jgi:hypothetical protein